MIKSVRGARNLLRVLSWVGCLIGASASALAEQPPSDQDSLDQQRRFEDWQQQQKQRFHSDPDIILDRSVVPLSSQAESAGEPCFPIVEVQLVSEEYKKFRWLEKRLKKRLEGGECLGANGINRLMTEAQNDVISAGYVTTRLVAEPQDLTKGLLTLTLLPGYVEDIRFVEGVPRRATYWNALPIKSGDILNLRHMEQGLENFKRVPSVDVNIDIEPGDRPGYSDLVIQWTQQKTAESDRDAG